MLPLQNFCKRSSCLKEITNKVISTQQSRIAAMSCMSSNANNRHISSSTSLIHGNQANNLDTRRRQIHFSSITQQATVSNDVKVTISSNTNSSTSTSNTNDSTTSSSGSSCSQGIPLDTNNDEEEEQEDMFVTADPILGHGTIKEWGGPRRGGKLAEPTRFGDWERKGRCTDF